MFSSEVEWKLTFLSKGNNDKVLLLKGACYLWAFGTEAQSGDNGSPDSRKVDPRWIPLPGKKNELG